MGEIMQLPGAEIQGKPVCSIKYFVAANITIPIKVIQVPK